MPGLKSLNHSVGLQTILLSLCKSLPQKAIWRMKLENRSNQNVAAENLIGNLGYEERKIQGAFLKFLKS